ncbi:MAG: hypothetical protein ACLFP1_03565 [Candidatus Goldiibacteriota bacterium]
MKKYFFCIPVFMVMLPAVLAAGDKITVMIEGQEETPVIKEEEPAEKIRERVIIQKPDPGKTKMLPEQMMDEKMLDVETQLLKQRVDDMERRFFLSVLGVMLVNVMGFIILFIMIRRR